MTPEEETDLDKLIEKAFFLAIRSVKVGLSEGARVHVARSIGELMVTSLILPWRIWHEIADMLCANIEKSGAKAESIRNLKSLLESRKIRLAIHDVAEQMMDNRSGKH